MYLRAIANRIRQKRDELKLTQDYIADELGIAQRTYSDLENGKTQNLRVSHLVKLAEIFKTSISDLLGIEDTKYVNIADKQNVGFQFIEKQVVVHKQKIDKHEQKISLHEEKIAELELIIKVLLQKDLE